MGYTFAGKGICVRISGPAVFPGPADTFEFLPVAVDFSETVIERFPQLRDGRTKEITGRLLSLATIRLAEAVSEAYKSVPLN